MSLIVGSLRLDDGGRYKNILGRAEEAYSWTDLLVIGELNVVYLNNRSCKHTVKQIKH